MNPGDKIICVDDDWTHVGDVLIDSFPVKGREYTAAGFHEVGDDRYVILAEQDVDPGFYGVDAFVVKDASASRRREMVSA